MSPNKTIKNKKILRNNKKNRFESLHDLKPRNLFHIYSQFGKVLFDLAPNFGDISFFFYNTNWNNYQITLYLNVLFFLKAWWYFWSKICYRQVWMGRLIHISRYPYGHVTCDVLTFRARCEYIYKHLYSQWCAVHITQVDKFWDQTMNLPIQR